MKYTPQLVVDAMNKLAGQRIITMGDLDVPNTGVQDDENEEFEEQQDIIEEPIMKTVLPNPDTFASELEDGRQAVTEGQEETGRFHEEPTSEPSESLRRSQRTTAGITRRYDDSDLDEVSGFTRGYGLALANISVKESLRTHGSIAYAAIKDELIQLFSKKKALQLVKWTDLNGQQKREIIRSHMFLKEKFDANGKFEKMKGRLVADGRGQDRNQLTDSYSPTARLESIINTFKIVVVEDRHYIIVDVGGAYLNARLDDDVYMVLDSQLVKILTKIIPNATKYVNRQGRIVVKVNKALYGLIQSARLWYDTLIQVLVADGFMQNKLDPCVLNKLIDGVQVTVIVYVDDLLITSINREHVDSVKRLIEEKFEEVKCKNGDAITYLGMLITKKKDCIHISMKQYINEIICEWPSNIREYVVPTENNILYNDESEMYTDIKLFHRIVAKLLYLSKRARPDIGLPVHFLCTRVKSPTISDVKKLVRVLGYLKATIDRTRIIDKSTFDKVVCFVDAAFALHEDGKGQTGAVIFVGDTAIDVITRKQKCATRDSTEAELVGLTDMLLEIEWQHEWNRNQGYNKGVPLVFQDNTSTIILAEQGGEKMRNKHLRALQAVVKEVIDLKDVELEHIDTDSMIADIFTKHLDGWKYHKFTKALLGIMVYWRSKSRLRATLIRQECVEDTRNKQPVGYSH